MCDHPDFLYILHVLVDSIGIFSADSKSAECQTLSVEHFEKIQDGRHKLPLFWKCSRNTSNNQKLMFLVSIFRFWGSENTKNRFWFFYLEHNEQIQDGRHKKAFS